MRKAVWFLSLLVFALLAACQQTTPAPEPSPTPQKEAMGEMGGDQAPMVEPMVKVMDQKPMDGKVVIDKVVAEKDGWIVIHIEKDGKPGPIIGYAPVKAGENEKVEVTIDLEQATETLFAMLHVDEGQMGTYEFPNGPDVPVKVGDKVVVKPFKIEKPMAEGEGMGEESAGEGMGEGSGEGMGGGMGDMGEAKAPMVEVADQKPTDGKVVIDKVVAEKDGWIVIHIEKDGKPGPIIGYAPVKAGENTQVEVTIDLEQATETLFAMLHVDEGQVGTYEFPNGPDVPVKVGDKVVVKPFKLLQGEGEASGAGEVVEVQILNYAYSPMELEVKVGTTVTWINMDYVPHTVTADNGAFDSGMMANGAQFSFTFNEPGTYTYICTYHPNMTGTVVVVP